MVVHKFTKLMPWQRKDLAHDYYSGKLTKKQLCVKYDTSYPTVRKVLARARHGDFSVHKSINRRYQTIEYGLKRLARVERRIEEKLRKQAVRYEKRYPGEMLHFDTKRLPLLDGQRWEWPTCNAYLFVAIDAYSRELYAGIYSSKSMHSSSRFLRSVIEQCPYTIETILTDNGTEYKGVPDKHLFMRTCVASGIAQRFTRVNRPQTNGKAERVIRTLMEGWYDRTGHKSQKQRRENLNRYLNYYNTVKPHKGIDDQTPLERLYDYFYNMEAQRLTRPTRRVREQLFVMPIEV